MGNLVGVAAVTPPNRVLGVWCFPPFTLYPLGITGPVGKAAIPCSNSTAFASLLKNFIVFSFMKSTASEYLLKSLVLWATFFSPSPLTKYDTLYVPLVLLKNDTISLLSIHGK